MDYVVGMHVSPTGTGYSKDMSVCRRRLLVHFTAAQTQITTQNYISYNTI